MCVVRCALLGVSCSSSVVRRPLFVARVALCVVVRRLLFVVWFVLLAVFLVIDARFRCLLYVVC